MLFLDYTPKLNETDMDIYHYIMQAPRKVTHMRIRELAYDTHTSTATILRFCRKFECAGFPEFKVRLQIHLDVDASHENSHEESNELIHFLNKTQDAEFQKLLNDAAMLLSDNSVLLTIGEGSSNILSEYASMYFSRMGIMTFRIEDPHNLPIAFMDDEMLSKTVVMALSVSGQTEVVLDYLTDMTLGRCPIISITNNKTNKIAKVSTINIPYYINAHSIKSNDVTSQVPVMYIIETIAKKLRSLKYKKE